MSRGGKNELFRVSINQEEQEEGGNAVEVENHEHATALSSRLRGPFGMGTGDPFLGPWGNSAAVHAGAGTLWGD